MRPCKQISNNSNIWTSLCSFSTFFYLFFEILFFWDLNKVEKALFCAYALSASYCFLASAIFHWFGSLSELIFFKLAKFDMSGIAVLIGGSMYVPIYYAFKCSPNIALIYNLSIFLLCILCTCLFLVPKFSTEEYRLFRIVIFGVFGASGILFIKIYKG
jgi:adiponectin receptor